VNVNGVAGLIGLLVIPGLFGLALLMLWLENNLTRQMVARDVAAAWESSLSPDQLEEAVSRSVARLFPSGF
jgi:hypothetical protein